MTDDICDYCDGCKHSKYEVETGNLWKTSGGRIVLDNHTCEAFAEPYDKILMTKKELTQGIKVSKFLERLIK